MAIKAPLTLTIADVDRVVNSEKKYIDYLWPESNIAVHLANIRQNHQGIQADFAAEYPIGNEIKSGINLYLEKLRDRQSIIHELHGMPIEFKEWEKLVEYAFADVVRTYKQLQDDEANQIPDALTPDDLLGLNIPETVWIAQDIIVESGITICAGLPKIGKSVLTLNLCKAIVNGEKFLGKLCKPTNILYLALEDTPSRLKTRLAKIKLTGRNINFLLNFPDLRQGLQPLNNAIERYQPKLIVIDTLLSGLNIKDENSPEVGIAMNGIHQIAVDRKVSFFIVHHHGKTKRDDPVLDLRGHTSLSGAVDIIIGLYKGETSSDYQLKSASRDGDPLDLNVDFDREGLSWSEDKDYKERQKVETEIGLFNTLRQVGTRASLDLISQTNGKDKSTNWKQLERMVADGHVVKDIDKSWHPEKVVYSLKEML